MSEMASPDHAPSTTAGHGDPCPMPSPEASANRKPLHPEEIEDQLKRVVWPVNGFAPGGYLNDCWVCGVTFIGDKRAMKCLACAINRLVDSIPERAPAALRDGAPSAPTVASDAVPGMPK
jgi:hypothetical protein